MQRWLVLPATVRRNHDFNVLIERHEEAQQALNGKLPEVTAQDLGDIGLADAEQPGRVGLFQAAFLHERVDLEHQLGLHVVLLCVRHAEIREHVSVYSCVLSFAHGDNALRLDGDGGGFTRHPRD